MQKVFSSHSQVAHVWAQRTQQTGRAGNVFFDGPTIYSYGTHYAIARFHEVKTKKEGRFTVVLFNSRTYSISTAKHRNYVRRALPGGLEVISVPEPRAEYKSEHERNLEYFRTEIIRYGALAIRAKKYASSYTETHDALIQQGNRYMELFHLRGPKMKSALTGKNRKEAEALIEQQREQARRQRARDKERQAQRDAESRENLAKWLTGETNSTYSISRDHQYLRMKKDGKTVETTTGAEFPLSHALLALRRVRQCVSTGQGWHRNGEEIRVGLFHIDAIDQNGNVVAGCHNITNAEIERFAKTINQ